VEFLPSSHRARFLMYTHAFWTLGSILVSLLAWLLLPYYGWRSLLLVTALPVAVVRLLACIVLCLAVLGCPVLYCTVLCLAVHHTCPPLLSSSCVLS
jgi:MFS family permease